MLAPLVADLCWIYALRESIRFDDYLCVINLTWTTMTYSQEVVYFTSKSVKHSKHFCAKLEPRANVRFVLVPL